MDSSRQELRVHSSGAGRQGWKGGAEKEGLRGVKEEGKRAGVTPNTPVTIRRNERASQGAAIWVPEPEGPAQSRSSCRAGLGTQESSSQGSTRSTKPGQGGKEGPTGGPWEKQQGGKSSRELKGGGEDRECPKAQVPREVGVQPCRRHMRGVGGRKPGGKKEQAKKRAWRLIR